jgi:hypothetical protein
LDAIENLPESEANEENAMRMKALSLLGAHRLEEASDYFARLFQLDPDNTMVADLVGILRTEHDQS